MPIGKNAIKRVENNGYSNVASSAPDMENSIVAEPALSEQKAAPAAAAETLPEAKMTSAEPAKRRRGPSRKGKARQGGDGGRFSDSRRAETENRKGR